MIPKHEIDETIRLMVKYEMEREPLKIMFQDIVYDVNEPVPDDIIAIVIKRLESVWLRKNDKLTNEMVHNYSI